MTLFEILGKISVDSKDAIGSINATETAADKASGKMNTSFGKVGGLLKGAFLGATAAAAAGLLAIGVAGVRGASGLEGATDRIQAALGITEGEAKRLGGVAQDVFLNNFGGSVTEAAGMVQTLRQQLGEMSDEQTSKLTQMAATISDVYGADYAETINSARTLTEQFGISNEQAFDLITTGFQKGLNGSGDFLESIGEYSTQFANGGATADQFFSTMESGYSAGYLGADKAADAFKEFRLRIQDGSKLTGESLAMLGINADDLAAKISSGQMTAADAFQLVINKLGETEDPMVRMQAGAGLLGSQFEDLGDTGVAALSMTTTSLEDMAGATDAAAKAAYDNLGGKLTSLWRILQTGATEALGPLIPLLSDFVDVLIDKAPLMIDAGKQVASYISTWSPHVTELIGAIGPVVTDIFGLMAAAWTNVVKPVWDTIAPLVAGMFNALGSSIRAFKLVLEGDFTGAWSEAVEGLKGFLTGLEGFLDNFFGGLWSLVKPGLIGMRDVILAKGEEIRDGFSAKLTELKTAVFEWSVDLWADIAATMSSFVGYVVNAAIEVYNGFKDNFEDLKSKVAEIVSGLWDGVKSHLETFATNVVTQITGIPERIKDVGQSIVDNLIAGITGKKGDLEKATSDTVSVIEETAADTVDARSPSKKLYKIGEWSTLGLAGGVADTQAVKAVTDAAESVGSGLINAINKGLNDPASLDALRGTWDMLVWEAQLAALEIKNALPTGAPVNIRAPVMGAGASVTPSVPLVTPEATAAWVNLVNIVIPQVSAAFGKLVNIDMPNVSVGLGAAVDIMSVQATAAGTARYHAVIGENQREWQARENERQARAIAGDTQNAMSVAHLAQMQSGALGAQAWIQATWQNTSSFLSGAVSWVGSTLSSAVSWVGSTISSAASYIGQAAMGIGTELIKLAFNEVPGLGAAMNAMAGGPMAMLIAYFVDLIGSTAEFQWIIDGATAIMQPLIQTFGRLIQAIWPLIEVVFARLKVAADGIAWVFDKVVNPVFRTVAQVIATVYNALARAINWALGFLGVRVPLVNVNASGPGKSWGGGFGADAKDRVGSQPPKGPPTSWAGPDYNPKKYVGKPGSPGYKPPKSPGYKAPGAPGRPPGSPSYKPPKIGSPGSGSTPGYSAPGSSPGGGSGGTKVSEITGPTRDLFADLLSPLVALPELIGIGNRTFDLLNQRLAGGTFAAVASPAAANLAPFNLTVNMNATGKLEYDGRRLAQVVSPYLAKAMEAHRRGRGG